MAKTAKKIIGKSKISKLSNFLTSHPFIITGILIAIASLLLLSIAYLGLAASYMSTPTPLEDFVMALIVYTLIGVVISLILVVVVNIWANIKSKNWSKLWKFAAFIISGIVLAMSWAWYPSLSISITRQNAINRTLNSNRQYQEALERGCHEPNDVYKQSSEYDEYSTYIKKYGSAEQKAERYDLTKEVYDAGYDCINGDISVAENNKIFKDNLEKVKAITNTIRDNRH